MNYLLIIAAAVTLMWDDPNPPSEVDGYIVYSRTNGGTYAPILGTTNTSATVSNLYLGTTYFFAVTATNHYGLESDFSNELMVNMPSEPKPPENLRLQEIIIGAKLQGAPYPQGPWEDLIAWPFYVVPGTRGIFITNDLGFYRIMATISDQRTAGQPTEQEGE